MKAKKFLSALFILCALFPLLSSCGAHAPKIEDYTWILRTAMHVENGQPVIDATDGTDTAHSEAKKVDVTLSASNGIITVTDNTNGKTYDGTYTVQGKTPEGTDYEISVNGINGYATVAMTTYADGSEEPTLPISLGEYTLYFYCPATD